jgi:hypothetical protein
MADIIKSSEKHLLWTNYIGSIVPYTRSTALPKAEECDTTKDETYY